MIKTEYKTCTQTKLETTDLVILELALKAYLRTDDDKRGRAILRVLRKSDRVILREST